MAVVLSADQCLAFRAQVAEAGIYLLEDETKNGTVLMLHVNGRAYENEFHKASMRRVDVRSRTGQS